VRYGGRSPPNYSRNYRPTPGNVEIFRRAFPEGAPPDVEALFSMLDENVEWDYVGAFPEVVTYHGPGEVREFLAQWSGAFDDFRFEAEEAIPVGDSVVFCLHQSGRGKDTGVQVESRTWQVFTFRDGKVVHCRGYERKADALSAAGLSS
jgi:ketosteroid isomerase-like protein